MSDSLEIRLFGGLRIERNGAPVSGFISAKASALFVYLACTRRVQSRDALAALFWGEMPEADAKNNLRQALSNLRKTVGDYLLITRCDARFRADAPYWLDVEAFEQLTIADHLQALQQAVALYEGDFLAGFYARNAPAFEEWMLAQRGRYRDLALYALHHLTERHLRERRLSQAIDAAGRLLAIDPWREETHRQLMLALAYDGRHSAALAQFELCRRILDEELGAIPSPKTVRLAERIRAAGERPRHNLPAISTPFFGRETELARIEAWLSDDKSRLLTVVGPGGAGKTRLALHAIRSHVNAFLEGVWLVSLAQTPPNTDLAAAIATAIGFQFDGSGSMKARLLDFLAEKEMLVALDSLERHLTGPDLALLAAALAKAPQVKWLVTSRERLNLQAESVLELGGLCLAPPRVEVNSSSQTLASPAHQLFLARARQVRPGFDSMEQEEAIARICHLVGGLPLAIELAAFWVRAMEPTHIALEIEKGLGFLQAGWRDMPERHRSIEAVFEYSWRMLLAEERKVYTLLSVFRGGFTLEGARSVADASPATLAGLVDKSLLTLENGRYRRHPMLRQFAYEKLAASPATMQKATRDHARFYARWMRRMDSSLFGGGMETVLRRVHPEMENLRLAWSAAIEQGDVAVINDLTDAFIHIFEHFGLYHEGKTMACDAIPRLEHAAATGDERAQLALGRVYGFSAACHFRLGECKQAFSHAQASLQWLTPFQPHRAYANALILAGVAVNGLNQLEQAIDYWRRSIGASRAAGFLWGECAAYTNLAEVLSALERFDEARECIHAAFALVKGTQHTELMAPIRQIMAGVALHDGDHALARAYAQEALALHRRTGHRVLAANTLAVLARIAIDQGQSHQAMAYLQESVVMLRELGETTNLHRRLLDLANVALNAQDAETAAGAIREVMLAARRREDEAMLIEVERLLERL